MTKLTTKQLTDGLLHRFLAPGLEQNSTVDAVRWQEGGSWGGCNDLHSRTGRTASLCTSQAGEDMQDPGRTRKKGALPTQSQKKGYLGLPSITE